MKKAAKFELEFLRKEKMARNTYSFYFNRKGIDFDFKPGQYMKIYLSIPNPDARGTSRYFTISSSPLDKDFLTITTKIIKSSFKLRLNALKPGEKVNIFGPLGYFDFDGKNKKQKVFLAGGIGITPFHSIIKYIDYKRLSLTVILIVSFALKEDAIFYDEMKNIESANSNVKVIYTLTKEKNLYPKFEIGRIDENMIKKYVHDHKKSEFFVVGPESFETSVLQVLRNLGASNKNIFSENFPGY